jgi:hypothetical protein
MRMRGFRWKNNMMRGNNQSAWRSVSKISQIMANGAAGSSSPITGIRLWEVKSYSVSFTSISASKFRVGERYWELCMIDTIKLWTYIQYYKVAMTTSGTIDKANSCYLIPVIVWTASCSARSYTYPHSLLTWLIAPCSGQITAHLDLAHLPLTINLCHGYWISF